MKPAWAVLTGTTPPTGSSRFVQPDTIATDSGAFNQNFVIDFAIGQLESETEVIPGNDSGSSMRAYATPSGDKSAVITMGFNDPQLLEELLIWNFRNGEGNGSNNNGTSSFTLALYDGENGTGNLLTQIGDTVALAPVNGDIAPSVHSLGGQIDGVRSAVLTINGDGAFVAVHEIGFVVPEPTSLGLMLAGGAMVLRRRRQALQH